jgi:nucleoside phosphorylase
LAIRKIALIFAMEAEALPLIRKLELVQAPEWGDPRLPFQHFIGHYKNRLDLVLSINGKDPRWGVDSIGTDPAVLNSYLTLTKFKPELCINCGTAGGFEKQGAQIGDVYLSHQAIKYHDRRIAIPGFDRYGEGHFPVADMAPMATHLGLKLGVITTGNSLDCTEEDSRRIQANQGAVKEMEAASIAYVAQLLGVPFIALKSVTDWVDSGIPAEVEFLKNLEVACARLLIKTEAVLDYLMN